MSLQVSLSLMHSPDNIHTSMVTRMPDFHVSNNLQLG